MSGTSVVVGYCTTCRNWIPHDEERPLFSLARFGACALGVVSVVAMCDRYQPLRDARWHTPGTLAGTDHMRERENQ